MSSSVGVGVGGVAVAPEEREVVAAGLRVRVAVGGAGAPVVVLHHSTGPLWGGFHDGLAGGRLVVAPDMPGYGGSERPESARTPGHLGVVLLRALDGLGLGDCDLVGLGFGGFVGAEMVAMNPGRFRSLCLVGAAGLRPREGEIHDPMMESWTEYMRFSVSSDEVFEGLFGAQPSQELLNLWDYSREMTARVAWKPWMWSLQLPDFLRGLELPVLVVWGGEDRVVPLDCARQFVELFPNSRLEVLAGVGHAVDLERPEELAELVGGFVASVEG